MDYRDLEALDNAYVSTFSTMQQTSWGYLFYNERQPDYYDANHAYISTFTGQYEEIIAEVITFYQEKNLVPRFYLTLNEGYQDFLEVLKERGFRFESFDSPVQLWKRNVELKGNPLVKIEQVTAETKHEAIQIECQIQELGGAIREKAFEEEFAHPAFTHYVLKYDGVPCSIACIFQNGRDARLESVATLKEYRGKGLIGQLIANLQKEVKARGIANFWVMPINERVEKVYQKSGFETVAVIKTGHAFYGGKGIKEIKNGD